ncbi:MAG: aldehyde dehydrogenase [Chelatococcus sp.]|uniref:aldehyde dehydrogenase n=1 Tax=Chelatococcus sp. TaxID=1953771 RepID=UPI0025B7C93D|nr:aldehyde dehydrogenase [Chelatococcus sp.]MBX3538457.1 aldehyde dehydrogenase [Chelatococcus sp.]
MNKPFSADRDRVLPFLVGDSWSFGKGEFESINPADGSTAAIVAEASVEDVAGAVAAARAALDNPEWRDLNAHRRARLLSKMADQIEANGEALARMQTSDNGKTIAESRAQVGWAAEMFRYCAAVCETAESEVVPSRGDYFAYTSYEPVGVVAAITPWNSPISLEAQKLAPALAAGNAIVLKSSEVTPQVGLQYGRMALAAGFPAGVLNVVAGFGGTVGRALVENPGVDMVTFTGGTVSGREIAKTAGSRLVPALLELGGKSPNIVFDDANLDDAVAGAVYGIYSNAGQSCIAGSRIFVHEAIYDTFVKRLAEAAKALVVGDPYDPATAVAPVSSFAHRDRIERMITQSREEGARVLAGGGRPATAAHDKGAFIAPTLLELDSNSMSIAQEEIFGPVACLLRFKDDEDLIAQANDTVFGLACGIWTSDYRRALRASRAIKAGTVWINTYKMTAVNMPFGGFKSSGIGRECGLQGVRAYQAEKSTYLNLGRAPVAWPPR